MRKFTETRILDDSKLRNLCIMNGWYTRGTNAAYNGLFARLYDEDGCTVNMTTDKLAEVAEDIMAHSDITDYTITTVMFELTRACYIYFEEVEA